MLLMCAVSQLLWESDPAAACQRANAPGRWPVDGDAHLFDAASETAAPDGGQHCGHGENDQTDHQQDHQHDVQNGHSPNFLTRHARV